MSFRNIYSNKTVFITGHTGFKGSWLTQWLLLLGAKVVGYSINIPTEPSLYLDLCLSDQIIDLRGDINDSEYLSQLISKYKPDFIFHLAAQSLVQRSYIKPNETFITNTIGTLNLLESIRLFSISCTVAIITSDKCYDNLENGIPFNENDPLGGHDPYSASKAAAEIITSSYIKSYFYDSNKNIKIFTARAGNVIGGGDWAENRIIPDCIRSLSCNRIIEIRNPEAIRPWQHVLEPLSGYLWSAACAHANFSPNNSYKISTAYNFGPYSSSNKTVMNLVDAIIKNWPGTYFINEQVNKLHEAKLLSLNINRAKNELGWFPVWNFDTTVAKTINWYRNNHDIPHFTKKQIEEYTIDSMNNSSIWVE